MISVPGPEPEWAKKKRTSPSASPAGTLNFPLDFLVGPRSFRYSAPGFVGVIFPSKARAASLFYEQSPPPTTAHGPDTVGEQPLVRTLAAPPEHNGPTRPPWRSRTPPPPPPAE